MDPKTELAECVKRARATAAKAEAEGRDFTAAERHSVETDLARAKTIRENLTKAADSKRLIDEVGELLKAEEAGGSGGNGGKLTAEHMTAAAKSFAETAAKAMTAAHSGTWGRAGAKSEQAQGSFTTGTPFVTGTEQEVVGPDPALGVLGLVRFDEKTFTNTHNFSYLREVTRVNNSAVVPDGVKKPVSEYELKEVHDSLKWIAHIGEPIPTRFLEDYGALAEYLRVTMSRDLYRTMGREIVNGAGGDTHLAGVLGTSGVLQTAWAGSLPATLRKARTTLANVDERPNAWLVNPTDAEQLDLFADDQGRFQSLREIMGNLPVVQDAEVPAGQAVLADWNQATVVMRQGDGVRLTVMDGTPHTNEAGEIDGSLWEFNECAIRAELRVGGLAITRPKAITVVDLTA